jgi:hypothetical protein
MVTGMFMGILSRQNQTNINHVWFVLVHHLIGTADLLTVGYTTFHE